MRRLWLHGIFSTCPAACCDAPYSDCVLLAWICAVNLCPPLLQPPQLEFYSAPGFHATGTAVGAVRAAITATLAQTGAWGTFTLQQVATGVVLPAAPFTIKVPHVNCNAPCPCDVAD